jgi:hypothetical protein
MNAIDGVTMNDIEHHAKDVLARGWNTGVGPEEFAFLPDPVRMCLRDVIEGKRSGGVRRRAEGINPSVQLEAARVRLSHGEGERIVVGICPLRAGKKGGPRFDLRRVERIGRWPHLQENGGKLQFLCAIENG